MSELWESGRRFRSCAGFVVAGYELSVVVGMNGMLSELHGFLLYRGIMRSDDVE